MTDSPYAGWEPLVPQDRLDRAVDVIRRELPHNRWLDGMLFLTAIDPEPSTRTTEAGLAVPDRLFRIVGVADDPSPDKKRLVREGKMEPQATAIVQTGWLSGWRESEQERGHYVTTTEDPLVHFLRWNVAALTQKLEDLSTIGGPTT